MQWQVNNSNMLCIYLQKPQRESSLVHNLTNNTLSATTTSHCNSPQHHNMTPQASFAYEFFSLLL